MREDNVFPYKIMLAFQKKPGTDLNDYQIEKYNNYSDWYVGEDIVFPG